MRRIRLIEPADFVFILRQRSSGTSWPSLCTPTEIFVREFIFHVSDACEKFQLNQAASQAQSLITETARTFGRALASV